MEVTLAVASLVVPGQISHLWRERGRAGKRPQPAAAAAAMLASNTSNHTVHATLIFHAFG